MSAPLYWEQRYASGGTSGKGSRGTYAELKADLVNAALQTYGITEVLDIGSGDGVVAALVEAEDYLGVDISPTAIRLAQGRNPLKQFQLLDDPAPREAHLSLDVLHHLVDDEDYRQHMALLFSARVLALVWAPAYSDEPTAAHSRHRYWQDDVPPVWRPERTVIYNPGSFHMFSRGGP
jgi:SAM-dependent methyltransferase